MIIAIAFSVYEKAFFVRSTLYSAIMFCLYINLAYKEKNLD